VSLPLIKFGRHSIGAGQPCFIIAEAGVNHNGDLSLARRLVDAAADAGADAVKFQTFKADRLVTAAAPKADYQNKSTKAGESQLEMLERLELTPAMHVDLMAYCRSRGIEFLSSPFDETSADDLLSLGLKLLKLPSGEITNIPFLEHVAHMRVPVILSTGMSSLEEVRQAAEVFQAANNRQLVLLHCVSNYPADPADSNLRAMQTMETAFGLPVGYSDHTEGIEVALAAVALGACVIEKHLTLDRSLPGPDHRASLEPDDFAALVKGVRIVERARGEGRKEPCPSEANTRDVARKSLVASQDVAAGAALTAAMISIKRPGTGLAPALRDKLVGRVARDKIPAGTLFTLEMLL
jgi:N,N'-diacetyllegionaminate synthase